MGATLVVNPGSSSKKYALFRDGTPVFSMRFERTALGYEQCVEEDGVRALCEGSSAMIFAIALEHMLTRAKAAGVLTAATDITVVVIRIVVPGTPFQKHCRIDPVYVHRLRDREWEAPLHVPAILKEIMVAETLLPRAELVAASDSAFHATMPPRARNYSLPIATTSELDLYRFGYHGLSVASVVRRHHSVTGYDPVRAVVCHMGSGVSVTAVQAGVSIDTSMGYAPGSGLPMATRAGDLDSGALLSLMRQRQLRPLDALSYLSSSGGLMGLGGTPDLRLVLEQVACSDSAATLALEHYVYHVVQAIAGSVVALGGIDSLVFTATAGERSAALRTAIVSKLSVFGLALDEEKNQVALSKDMVISSSASAAKIAIIRTDEMGEMYHVSRVVLDSKKE